MLDIKTRIHKIKVALALSNHLLTFQDVMESIENYNKITDIQRKKWKNKVVTFESDKCISKLPNKTYINLFLKINTDYKLSSYITVTFVNPLHTEDLLLNSAQPIPTEKHYKEDFVNALFTRLGLYRNYNYLDTRFKVIIKNIKH